MSGHDVHDPFAAPQPGAQQWQGTPVPLAPGMIPPQHALIPPPSGYASSPSTPWNSAYPVPPMPLNPGYPLPPTPLNPGYPLPPASQNPGYGAVAYPPPPPAGYMYAPHYNAANTSKNWMGITSLVLSLANLLLMVTCIPGVIFGHMGLAAAKRGEANNRGLALAGVIIGWIFIGFWLLFIGLLVVGTILDSSSG